MPHVDGVRNAKQLARVARVDPDVVLRSLRVLLHYRCLAVVDTFQYSNVYRVGTRLAALAAAPDALDACLRFALRGAPGDRGDGFAAGRERFFPPADRAGLGRATVFFSSIGGRAFRV
mmetsp:Transcript_19198/g.59096  ORF Transcript_19198/g.59096 Transcript_19198/m.59096 type:complete len:118 (-) Transcript_19198:392-745(-)